MRGNILIKESLSWRISIRIDNYFTEIKPGIFHIKRIFLEYQELYNAQQERFS
ncbi:hypothetical protein HMPREF3212_04339 [Citrobacter freundii]|nr:hypothetical protein HMPREF3212_04339 [Citrobacter freundii]